MATFTAFCDKLGINLKAEKSEFGVRVTFLGLEGLSPCKANNYQLSVSLTKDKASNWDKDIAAQISKQSVSPP